MSSCGAKNVWLKLGSSVTMHNDSSSVAVHLVIRTFLPTHSNSSLPSPSSHRCANGLRESMAG